MHQALEKIQSEKFGGGGGTVTEFEDETVPELMRKSIAVYEAARCVIGYMIPFYDEISKVTRFGLVSRGISVWWGKEGAPFMAGCFSLWGVGGGVSLCIHVLGMSQ